MGNDELGEVRSRYRYMIRVLDALRALGGNASAADVYRWIEDGGFAHPPDLITIQTDGGTRFRKEVRWARKELFDAGYIDAPASGQWSLTQMGMDTHLTPDTARLIVRTRTKKRAQPLPSDDEVVFAGTTEIVGLPSGWASGPGNGRPTVGPRPGDWSGEVTRTMSGEAWTYLMRFGDRDVWKIGHTGDLAGRLADINRHVPTEALGEGWAIIAVRSWPTALLAYEMEQRLFRLLDQHRTRGERLSCEEGAVFDAWATAPDA